MRYGLNFGPVVVSRIGTARQATVTLTGDTINVAARLMEIAKASGAAIAVAESVFEALGPAEAELAEGFGAPREVTVRGRAAALVVRLAGAEGAAGNARSAGQIRAGVP
jgi:adenylate cyclase